MLISYAWVYAEQLRQFGRSRSFWQVLEGCLPVLPRCVIGIVLFAVVVDHVKRIGLVAQVFETVADSSD